MLRALATWIAKWTYIWNKEREGGLHTWSARVSERKAEETRALITKMNAEAEEIELRIKHVAEMEEKGFWLCKNGHETPWNEIDGDPKNPPFMACPADAGCLTEAKLIKRSEMTGQEIYESDKGRREVEQMLADQRKKIGEKEAESDQQDATTKYFRQQAESSRKLADAIRNL